jgi:GH25 family lysozyme M1 (1,4-beta-N-acetylmuramidase)
MSHIIIHGPANELIFERTIAPNETAHLHAYFTVDKDKPTITLPARGEEGVDLSANNDCQDGPKLIEAGKRWGYARITMGITGIDRRWKYHRAIFRLAEMLDGAYHYLIHNLNAKGQHDNLYGQIGSDFGCLPIVGDVERRAVDKEPGVINKIAFTQLLYDWLRRCEDTWQHKPLIYTNLPEWLAMTTEPVWAKEYNFFVAQYNSVLNSVHASWNVVAWQYAVKPILSISPRDIDHDRWLGGDAPTPGARHNFAPRTNQQVINLFFAVAGDKNYIEWITRAGLTGMFGPRKEIYNGPDIEDLQELTAEEKAKLVEAVRQA